MKFDITFGLNVTPQRVDVIKSKYKGVRGFSGLVSKGLALLLVVPLSILRFVALMTASILLMPFQMLAGIFAPNWIRDKVDANKTSRLGYVAALLFSPLLAGIGILAVLAISIWRLPTTFRQISLGFDNLFSKITFAILTAVMKHKSKSSNSADYGTRTSTTSELNSKLGAEPNNTADFSNTTNAKREAEATTPAAKPADASNDTSYAFDYSATTRRPGQY